MNAVIIDDEVAVRNTITKLLADNFPEINVIASVGTIEEGYRKISEKRPDLLFLDIELPDGLGFDMLKKFDKVDFRVIFITGHQEYALRAIKVSALDYLLKPIDLNELKEAVEKACNVINHEEEQMKLLALTENMQGRKKMKRIILRTSDALQLVSVSDIIRAEADSNYTHFYLTGNRHIIVSRTIKEFDTLLSGSGLIRTHQSHLVNLASVDRYVKRDGGYLILKEGSTIPVSPNLKKMVLNEIESFLYE